MSSSVSESNLPRTFHLLTEAEPFSEFHGGAISRWVANVLQLDSQSIVLAPSADDSWRVPAGHIRIVPGLLRYKRINDAAGGLLRWPIRKALLRKFLNPAIDDLRAGDTLWVHNRPEFAAALAPQLRRAGARLVLHLHNSHLLHWPEKELRSITADCTVFVSHFLEQQARSHFPLLGRSEVLPNGADSSIFYPRPQLASVAAPPIALFVGRLVPDKGLHIFVEAMRLLYEKQIAIEGVVLGSAGFGNAPQTSYIRDLQQKSSANVTFQPYCAGPALGERFRRADISCVPSCWQDPMPLVVVEAMATGLPVVASRSGGIPEMLADGGGILVDRGSAAQLADALELLATNIPLRRRLGNEAHASFHKSFTWDVVRGNYRRILHSVQTGQDGSISTSHAMHREAECKTLQTSA